MAKIISFMTEKGGSGKTTLCTITAVAVHHRTKKKVLVIDGDKQGSLRDLREMEGYPEKGYPVVWYDWSQKDNQKRFIELIEKSENEYDVIFIDSPGRIDETETNLIVGASDIIAVPLVASPFDVKSARHFLDIIKPIVEKYNKQVIGIINKRDRTVEHSLLGNLDGYNGLELMTAYISNLARYKRDVSTVTEIVPKTDPTDEYNQYIKEFIKLLK